MLEVEVVSDQASAGPLARLAAVLDHDGGHWPPDEVPPLGHWLYFLPIAAQSALGVDGHPAVAADIAALGLPRRMWAGGRLEFLRPIRVGQPITRRSSVASRNLKEGASGRMMFVTWRHEIWQGDRAAVIEEQDLVYRAPGGPAGAAVPPAGEAPRQAGRTVRLGPAALFRFSALTFNAHRIHYDREYTREVEGYPDLVVQGPLVATLLMDEWMRCNPGSRPARFAFRARAPLFVDQPIILAVEAVTEGADLSAIAPDGRPAMTAQVTY
jgi:3-methylfumaryl-CoA hydratase